MANGFTMTLDTREFSSVLDDYMKFQKRTPADVINAKLYYIGRNATITTKSADPARIESDLRGPSTKYPEAPLMAVIINSNRGREGKKGLTGEKMAREIEKQIKKRKNAINFVRAGWKNAIQILETYMRSKGEFTFARRWQPLVDKATMRKKNTENLGKATVARIECEGRVWGEIQNDVHGKDGGNLGNLEQVKQEGLQRAVDKEVESMRGYLDRKLNPVHQAFNRKMGT